MAVTLHVDSARWRDHQARTVAANPGLVPVVKGNGYGFGPDVLLAETVRLNGATGLDTIAVGTYAEAPRALDAFPGDVLVMEPYRPVLHGELDVLSSPSLVHTITYRPDLDDLAARTGRPRFVVEGLTSMNRHGVPADWMDQALAGLDHADLLGLSLHLPLGEGHLQEVSRWVDRFAVPRWYVSHLSPAEQAALRAAYPEVEVRPRIGTELWLGDPGATAVRAHVLDVRQVATGDRAGYRQRRLHAGHLVVVSGGTSHGVAMESPSPASSWRQRAIVLAEGALEASGRVRSPFRVGGRSALFVEPPHMQVSLVALPEGVSPPEVGEEIDVRVRATTLSADAVVLE